MTSDLRSDYNFVPPTKVQKPLLRTSQIARRQLEANLRAALIRARLVLVVAPAGFGKTTAVVRAIEACRGGLEAFWVSADEGDDLQRLLEALVVAVEASDVPWRMSVRGLMELTRESEAGPSRVAEQVAAALGASEVVRGTIIIDDAHRIRDDAVFGWLNRLIERLPKNWTILMSSREEPPIPLARLRLSGELAEFRSSDLRFGLEEFAELASAEHRRWTREDLEPVWARMAGWPAGCELALQAGLSKAIAANAGVAAFDFLSSEVLDHLPDEFRRFLIECSILPELSEEVCAAVTGIPDTSRWLREITRRGLFVSELGRDRPSLKLHDLFRDFLYARLLATYTEDQVGCLFVRAAVAETSPELRISYLIEAKDYMAAEKELSVIASVLLPEGELERLTNVIRLFPRSYGERGAEIAFISGLCESCYPRWEDTKLHMSNAARLFREAGQTERCNRARAYELVAYFGLARTDEAMTVLSELEQETLDIGTQALCAFAGYLLSRVGGTVDREMQYFDRMLDALCRCDDLVVWNQCGLHIYLGLQRGMRGRAERYATGALSIAGEKYEALRDSAMSMRAWHNLLTGDYARATAILGEVEANHKWNSKPYSVRGSILIAKSLTIFLTGNTRDLRAAATDFYSIFDRREGISWAYWRGLTSLFFGKLYAAMEDWDGLDLACQRLDEELRMLDVPYLRLGRTYLGILRALHRDGAGISRESVATIDTRPIIGDYLALEPAMIATRAIIHARQREFVAAWRDLSRLVASLETAGETFHLILLGTSALKELANIPFAGGNFDEQRQVLLALVEQIEEVRRTSGDQSRRRFFDLSAREIEVLERLANGDSNKVIARKLALSPHTVKRHVANILDKLTVQSRGQAAAVYRTKFAP